MSAHFSFAIDPARGLIRIAMAGLFLPADVAAFLEARREAHAALGWPRNSHVTLNDVTAMKIQPQMTVEAFHAILADPAYRSRRLAFVVTPTLAKHQLMRALDARDARCFADAAGAEAWLFEEQGEADVLPFRRVA